MVLSGKAYVDVLKSCGLDYFTGVPCSLIKSLIRELETDPEITYFPAIREDIAVSMAAGAWLAGKQPMVLVQNSGLGNSLDVLLSLNATYKIPLLFLVTWRGYEHKDEPQHWLWGDYQNKLLEAIQIPYTILTDNVVEETVNAARLIRKQNSLHALILRRWSCIDEAI